MSQTLCWAGAGAAIGFFDHLCKLDTSRLTKAAAKAFDVPRSRVQALGCLLQADS